jgi:hypothetical protein
MARRNSRSRKIEKAQRQISVLTPADTGTAVCYLDTMKQLSKINRKLYPQGMNVAIQSVEFYLKPSSSYDTIVVSAATAGDTWSVHNAHVKGRALFDQMNALVLDDNPSVKSKWHDFKIYFNSAMRGAAATHILEAVGNPGVLTMDGEWNYSDYVLPQHDVAVAGDGTGIPPGEPLPADQTNAHLVGPDSGSPGSWSSVGLVNAYELSRATVDTDQPNVPAGLGDSFFSLLTDSGSQEPELAAVLSTENDNPPYPKDDYPGGALNSPTGWIQSFDTASNFSPNGLLQGFMAQCGLIEFTVVAYSNGEAVAAPEVLLKINVAPGTYKGIGAQPMGQ